MMNQSRLRLLLICLIVSGHCLSAKNFIFDLGGVLINTNQRASLLHMGPLNLAQYSFQLKMNPFHIESHIKATLFTTLEAAAQLHNFEIQAPLHLAYDEAGNPLPYLMRAWLQGTMTSEEIRTLINHAIIEHAEWFKNKAEQRIITNLIGMIFTPKHFIATRKIDSAGVAFIKQCKKHKHKVYVLSNWDAESFALLKEKHSHLFDLFDGIIISGDVNTLKPHPTMYHALLKQYQLNPDDCWFIDDQQENVIAAQQIGINAVVHTACFKKLKQNIQNAVYSKSVTRRENFKNNGISVSNTKQTSNAIIEGEKISPTDSTKYNCFPANA